jgi:hypothetical protein
VLNFVVTNNTNTSLFSAQPSINPTNGILTYTSAADANGTAQITVELKDNGGTANGGADTSTTKTFTIAVNPVNHKPSFTSQGDQRVDEDSGPQMVAGWVTNFNPGPANESGQNVADYIVTDANGDPVNSNLFMNGGQPDVLNDGTLTYTPAPDANGSITLKVKVQDNGGTLNGGVDTGDAQDLTITIVSVNDAPVNTVPTAQSTDEDTALTFKSANGNLISISDVDAGSNAVQVRLEATNGKLTLLGNTSGLTFASVDSASNDNDMTFTGTITNINSALSELRFDPDANFNGDATLKITTNDQGDNGSGGALSDTDTVNITVNAVNDAPTVTVAAGGSCGTSGTTGTINLTVGDVESEAKDLSLSHTSSNARVVPNANISFGGSGANRTLTLSAAAKRSGTATVTVTVSDGDQMKTSSIPINVNVGTDATDPLDGTDGTDIIFGKNGNDTINALAGNDLLCGGNGVGTMSGGLGDDTLDGAKGNDELRGEAGKDILRGGMGNDRLTGGTEGDFFNGGPGTDTATDFNAGEGDTKDATIP